MSLVIYRSFKFNQPKAVESQQKLKVIQAEIVVEILLAQVQQHIIPK